MFILSVEHEPVSEWVSRSHQSPVASRSQAWCAITATSGIFPHQARLESTGSNKEDVVAQLSKATGRH
jgi:hypothetical protein